MYNNKITNSKIYSSLTFALMIFLFTVIIQAQNSDSLIQIIRHSQSADKINDAKNKLPEYLSKIDMEILDVISQLKAEGITQANISQKEINKRFSNDVFQIDKNGNIHSEIYMNQLDSKDIEWLRLSGINIEYIDYNFNRVTCNILFDAVENLAKNERIKGIYSIPKPIVDVGQYTTAGDAILSASTTRSSFNINGSGIKVGVISDGCSHYSNAINSGDLPSTYQVIYNRFGGDEGTALSEIIYDLAPGVSLAFADYGSSESSFASSITALRNAGCNIIVDDVLYYDEPIFEDGTIAIAVDNATANGVKYISSAGNRGDKTWFGQSADGNSNTWMEFSGSSEVNSITIQGGNTFVAVLQWANKWGLSNDDYDLYLFASTDPNSQVLASSISRQNGNDNPKERISWTNSDQNPRTVYLRVKFYSVQAARVIKLLGFGTGSFNYITDGGVNPHAAANSCISVGAINASTPQTIASYSSHGPSRIYTYDSNGNPVSYIERLTPTICGIDGVQTYVGTTNIWPSGYPLFYGTSAAAPHIAGIAALILSLPIFSDLNWQQIVQKITLTATKVSGMGGQNFTNAYGYGRADNYQSERNVYVNATVPSGKTLQLSSSGASLIFANGSSLTVNGTLNATSTNFDKSGSSGQWGGIKFNSGSSGSLNYCDIKNAGWGITCNSVLPSIRNCTFRYYNVGLMLNNIGSPSTHISGNLFYGTGSSQAIACYYSSPYIDGGAYFDHNSMGVFGVGASPWVSNSFFLNNSMGFYLAVSSNASIGGLNVMIGNGTAIYLDGPGNVQSYTSDIYPWNPGDYAVRANQQSAYVVAQNNYWGPSTPNPAHFLATNGAIIFYQPGHSSPWTNFIPKISASSNETGEDMQGNDPAGFSLDENLLTASKLMMDKNFKESVKIYLQEFKKEENSPIKKNYLLYQIAECYKASGEEGFIDFLNKEVRPKLNENDELFAATLELENLFLIRDKNFSKALENLNTLKTKFAKNDITLKNALFNLGYVQSVLLSDANKGKAYFDELNEKYPDDILTWQAKLLTGEIDSIPASKFSLPKEGLTEAKKPDKYALFENYPNPFNPTTIINYSLPTDEKVMIKVYDILGREVALLVNEVKSAGTYSISFNASNLSSGVYFYSITAGNYHQVKKMVLSK